MLDILDGRTMWNSRSTGIVNSLGYLIVWETGQILLYGTDAERWPGKDVRIVVLADLVSGKPVWKSEEFFKDDVPILFRESISWRLWGMTITGNQIPVFDTPTTAITFMTRGGIKKHDMTTGELIWQSKVAAERVPALKLGFAQMMLSRDRDVIYVPYKKTLYAIQTNNGRSLCAKDPKLDGIVHRMVVTDHGLLVEGGEKWPTMEKRFITLLDPATGERVREKPFKEMKGATNFVVREGKVVLCRKKSLYAIDLATGSYDKIVDNVKFRGKEIPAVLDVRKDGYLLLSSQNLALYDFQGNQKYHSYFGARGRSALWNVVSTVGIYTLWVAADFAISWQEDGIPGPRSGLGPPSGNPLLTRRIKATANLENYTYVFTTVKEGDDKAPGLVKVNKNTGEVEKQVVLGIKKPRYLVDGTDARLFFLSGKKELTCYGF